MIFLFKFLTSVLLAASAEEPTPHSGGFIEDKKATALLNFYTLVAYDILFVRVEWGC